MHIQTRSLGVVLGALAVALALSWLLPPQASGLHPHVIVDKARNRLYLFSGGHLLRSYPVATGREIGMTPEGRFHIANKVLNPGGGPPAESLFGSRWLGLSTPIDPTGTKHGIHGTNEPGSIGLHSSAGCIRMSQPDLEDLYERVSMGTPVVVARGVPLVWWVHRWLDRVRASLQTRLE